jgi:hypothetical protein
MRGFIDPLNSLCLGCGHRDFTKAIGPVRPDRTVSKAVYVLVGVDQNDFPVDNAGESLRKDKLCQCELKAE